MKGIDQTWQQIISLEKVEPATGWHLCFTNGLAINGFLFLFGVTAQLFDRYWLRNLIKSIHVMSWWLWIDHVFSNVAAQQPANDFKLRLYNALCFLN